MKVQILVRDPTTPSCRFKPVLEIEANGPPQSGHFIEVMEEGIPRLIQAQTIAWRDASSTCFAYCEQIEGAFGLTAVHLAGGLNVLTNDECKKFDAMSPIFIELTFALLKATDNGVDRGDKTLRDLGEKLSVFGGVPAMFTAALICGACNGLNVEIDLDRTFNGIGRWVA
jgi:hypothetical protein